MNDIHTPKVTKMRTLNGLSWLKGNQPKSKNRVLKRIQIREREKDKFREKVRCEREKEIEVIRRGVMMMMMNLYTRMQTLLVFSLSRVKGLGDPALQ